MYEDSLTKVLQIEMDEYYHVNPVDRIIEEQLESMQKINTWDEPQGKQYLVC